MNWKIRSTSAVLIAALAMTVLSFAAGAAPAGEDTNPPLVYGVTVAPNPATLGDTITVTAVVNDGEAANARLKSAKFSVDGGGYLGMTPFDGTFDTPAEGVSGRFEVQKLGSTEVCVKAFDAAGNESEPACAQLVVESEIGFGGFFDPVSNLGNNVKVGKVIPLTWAMVDAEDKPITERNAYRGVFSYAVDCGNQKGDPNEAVQEVGRFNQTLVSTLSSGEWTALWRPSMEYAGTCRVVYVLFADGSTSPQVMFRFH